MNYIGTVGTKYASAPVKANSNPRVPNFHYFPAVYLVLFHQHDNFPSNF